MNNKGISSIAVAIVVIAIVAVGVVAYVILTTPAKPKEIELSGTVTTTGTATTPEKITFTSIRDNKTYVAACVGGGNPATYSIVIPNGDSYKVTITWKAFGIITGGDADAGTLNLDETEPAIVKNWAG